MHIAIIGAGAVGGWIGGHFARLGVDVVLIDTWPEHVTAMRERGLALSEPGSRHQVPVRALHIGETQSLHRKPVDVAFVCVKLYDTDWAVSLIAPYLAPSGFVVTLQNGLIEDRVAAIVGWERTVGCIGGGLLLALRGPGDIVRACRSEPGGAHKIFHVGETHGRPTPRAQHIAALLDRVDATEVTSNLWGARWSKLTANSMNSALCAISGQPMSQLYCDPLAQKIMLRLGSEALAAGRAAGFDTEDVLGLAADVWLAAEAGDAKAAGAVQARFAKLAQTMNADFVTGMAQDLAKGRRTEIEFMNGCIVEHAARAGVAAPTHASVVALVERVSSGGAAAGPQRLHEVLGSEG